METIIFKTLMHSIWQGLILAALTALILLFTRNASSSNRYKWLTACLMLFTISTVVTFIVNIRGAAPVEQLNSNIQLAQSSINNVVKAEPVIESVFRDNFVLVLNYLNQQAALIVWVWMLIIFVKSIQMAISLRKIHFLKNNEVYYTGSYWEERLEALCVKFKVRHKVSIMQSGIAKAPLVAGHFKPLILIPLGLMNNLTPAEVEAIISHELAHIHRKDYLVNLLQSFLEIIFFFNPAVLWINRLIREERENCCDDLSLSANVKLRDYISALITCSEMSAGKHQYALGFAGQKGQLMNRVNRMIYKKRVNVNTLQKLVMIAVLFCVQLVTAALSMPAALNGKQATQAPAVKQKHTTTTTKTSEKTTETLTVINNSASESISKGKKKKPVKSVAVQQPAPLPISKMPKDLNDHERRDYEAYHEYQKGEFYRKKYDDEYKKAEVYRTLAEKDRLNQEAKEKGMKRFTEEDGKRLNNELFAEGIIKNKNNTSYKLSNTELIVDGVKQPEALRKKYADKYIQPGMTIVNNYDYSTETKTSADKP